MNIDELRLQLEDLEIKPEVIDELISGLQKENKLSGIAGLTSEDKIFELKNKLDNESDWKKRAAIAARIISERLG